MVLQLVPEVLADGGRPLTGPQSVEQGTYQAVVFVAHEVRYTDRIPLVKQVSQVRLWVNVRHGSSVTQRLVRTPTDLSAWEKVDPDRIWRQIRGVHIGSDRDDNLVPAGV